MLRRALQRLRAPDDPDQLAVYRSSGTTAARHRIFLKRHMRADDLADPARWPGLLARIESIAASGHQSRQHDDRSTGCGTLELLRRRRETRNRTGGRSSRPWTRSVDEGVPPSDREIRDLLLPVIDDLPDRDDLPPGFRLVLREIDRYLATRTPPPMATPRHEPTAEVKEAARLLGGRSVVLIGGIRRPEAQESLKTALGLKELIWIETKEHQSIEAFEPAIARPGRGPGPAGHPLVEPCVRRRQAVLRPPRQAAGPAAGRLRPRSGRRPDPRAVQRGTAGRLIGTRCDGRRGTAGAGPVRRR